MNFETFLIRLKEARDFSRNENAYSHIIYDIFNLILDTSKYILIDTSTYKRTDENTDALVPKDAIAVPDFVIGNRAENIDDVERKGCVEVKYHNFDIIKADKLSDDKDRLNDHYREGMQRRGYKNLYQNVVYTNGWRWRFITRSSSEIKEFDFTDKNNQTDSYYEIFLEYLFSFNWDISGEVVIE